MYICIPYFHFLSIKLSEVLRMFFVKYVLYSLYNKETGTWAEKINEGVHTAVELPFMSRDTKLITLFHSLWSSSKVLGSPELALNSWMLTSTNCGHCTKARNSNQLDLFQNLESAGASRIGGLQTMRTYQCQGT